MTNASSNNKDNSSMDRDIPVADPSGEETMDAEQLEELEGIVEGFNAADETDSEGADSELLAQKDKYLRLAAEYDNYRKRTSKEVAQASLKGQADLIKKLLDSLDDLARFASVESSTADSKTLHDGVTLIERNIMKVLEGIGVEVINPVDSPFDPNLHEALTTQPTDSSDKDNIVAQVYQRGYQLKDLLLRPARVVVFKS